MLFRRRTIWLAIGLVLAAGYVGWASYRVAIDDSDLIDFHLSSLHWWRTGQFTKEFGVRHYLPAFVILMAPLVAWPLKVTAPLWATVNIVLLVLTVRQCARLVTDHYPQTVPFSFRWVWPMVLALPYIHSTLGLGQVNLLVLWLCVVAFSRCWSSRRDVTAGLLIAVAGVIKLYPLVLALFWLARGRWRAFAAAVLGAALLAGGLSVLGFGWQGTKAAHQLWLAEARGEQYRSAEGPLEGGLVRHLLFWKHRNQFHRHNNQSLAVVVRRLTTDLGPAVEKDRPVHILKLTVGQSRWLYLVLAGAVLGLLVVATWRARKDNDPFNSFKQWSAWLAGAIAFVPIYWTHYFILSLPAMALLVADVWWKRRHALRYWSSGLLVAAWLLAIPLLGLTVMRLVGLHCWLTLATMAWALSGPAVAPGDQVVPNPKCRNADPASPSAMP